MPLLARIHYLTQRVGRNLLPEGLARAARTLLGVVPGPEMAWPDEIADLYVRTAEEAECPVPGRRVLVFGSGTSFAVACRLLRAGAAQVVLYDKYARPDDRVNGPLADEFPDLVGRRNGRVVPTSERLTLIGPPEDEDEAALPEVDLIVSSSVLEHVEDVPGCARRLAAATAPGGVNLHFVDLRDHFFATPFEMLRYSERTWSRWLDPRSHLNRYRIPDYEQAFRGAFEEVSVEVTERDPAAFQAARHSIRPHFLTGEEALDSATIILLRAARPRAQNWRK